MLWTKTTPPNSRNLHNLFLFGVCLNAIGKIWTFWFWMCFFIFFLTCSFSIKEGHLFTSLQIFPPFQTPYSSVLCHLWKSLNLCLNLYLMCSSSTASLSEFNQRDQEEDAFDTSAVPGGCSCSLAESYERGYFRSDMDLYVSLWHGLQSSSLRRVWISAVDAWIILLFITCFQAREPATATRRLTLPACTEVGFVLVPYKARTSLKQHKTTQALPLSQGQVVFSSCVTRSGRALAQRACINWPVLVSCSQAPGGALVFPSAGSLNRNSEIVLPGENERAALPMVSSFLQPVWKLVFSPMVS